MSHNMTEPQDIIDKRKLCWTSGFYACGYAHIFQRKADRLRRLRRVLSFLGIVVPVAIGIIATKFFTQSLIPNWLITATSILSFVLLLFSIWGIIAKWEDTYFDLIQYAQANTALEQSWRFLATETAQKIESKFSELAEANTKQRQVEKKLVLSEKENRRAMRFALFEKGKECAGCNQRPKSLRPSNCDVCGNY